MPANHKIDTEARLLITTWEGEARDIEVIKALTKYQKDIQNHSNYIDYNEVLDCSNVTNIKLTSEGIQNIARIASDADQSGSGRKLAFIVASNLAFGLARMYEIYRGLGKKSQKKIRIFKNKKDAFEWVQDKS